MAHPITCLIEVNQSTLSAARLYQAARRLRRWGSVCMLHVSASGRAAEKEAGQRLLREAVRALRRMDAGLVVEARLEIGETAERIAAVAEEKNAALIVMAAYGAGDFPYLSRIGRTAGETVQRSLRPVLLVTTVGATLHRPRRSRRQRLRRTPPILRAGQIHSPLQTLPSPL